VGPERWRTVRIYTRARRHEVLIASIGDIPIPTAHWWQVILTLLCAPALWFTRAVWFQFPWVARVIFPVVLVAGVWKMSGWFASNPLTVLTGAVSHAWDRWRPNPAGERPTRVRARVPVIDTGLDPRLVREALAEVDAIVAQPARTIEEIERRVA